MSEPISFLDQFIGLIGIFVGIASVYCCLRSFGTFRNNRPLNFLGFFLVKPESMGAFSVFLAVIATVLISFSTRNV